MSYGRSIAVLFAQRFLSEHAQSFAQASERLSSGLRINRASDDAAALAISSRLRSDVRVYNQALRNGNDAISALAIADGSLTQLSDVVTRLKELATQASNGSFSRMQRISLNEEAGSLVSEFNRIVSTTDFNNLQLFSPNLSRMRIQLGYGIEGSIDFGIGSELRRNIGTGFEDSVTSTAGVSAASNQALGDVNGDGNLDLVVGAGGGFPSVYLSLGNGDGSFQAYSTISASGNTNKVALEDVNNDGRLDLLTSSTGATLDVFLNQGGSTPFSSYSTYTTSASANRGIEVADINGDGAVDLVTSGNNNATVSVLMGTGSGTFGSSTAYTFSASLKDMKLRDFNGDGILDIGAVSNSGFHVKAGSSTGTFGSEILTSVSLNGTRMDSDDINGDGIYDIVATNSLSGAVVYHGRSDGTFELAATLDPTLGAAAIADSKLTDLDGDGILDVLLASSDYLTFMKGKGDGTYEERAALAGSFLSALATTGDLNGDGVQDLIAASSHNGDVEIFLATTEESATIQRFNLSTRETALEALEALEAISERIGGELGAIGSTQSRVLSGVAALRAMTDRSEEARARIEDADVAVEAAQTLRSRILQDAAAAVLSHATTNSQFLIDLVTEAGTS